VYIIKKNFINQSIDKENNNNENRRKKLVEDFIA